MTQIINEPFYKSVLPPKCLEFAETELGETQQVREECLAEIISWLRENPKIKAKDDAKSLLQFLRCSKFNIEKTKQRMVR